MAGHAESLIAYTATVDYYDQKGEPKSVRYRAWTEQRATLMAWKFIRPRRLCGEMRAFRVRHEHHTIAEGGVGHVV